MSMPRKNQIPVHYNHEHRNLFGFANQAEFEAMQYMTFVTPVNGERGTLLDTRGNWEDEIAALRAQQNGSRSNSGTPAPQKTFKNKISLSAYKKNGMKAPPSAVGTPDVKSMPGHSRNTSAVSLNAISMSRGLSSESLTDSRVSGGIDARDTPKDVPRYDSWAHKIDNTNANVYRSSAAHAVEHSRSGTSKPNGVLGSRTSTSAHVNGTSSKTESHGDNDRARQSNDAKQSSTPVINGTTTSSSHRNGPPTSEPSRALEKASLLQSRDSDRHRDKQASSVHSSGRPHESGTEKSTNNNVLREKDRERRSLAQDSRRALPPPNRNADRGTSNRTADTPTQRRDGQGRADNVTSSQSRTALSHSTLPKKPTSLPPKPPVSAVKAAKPTALASMLGAGKGKIYTPKSSTPRPDTPKNIPALLSPLHPTLESSPLSDLPSSQFDNGSSATKKRPIEDDNYRSRAPTSAPKRKAEDQSAGIGKKKARRSVSPERKIRSIPLPRLLSPDLPPLIDKMLGELKDDKKKVSTVEERHEQARRPDAKGVARKTVKSRGGKGQKRKSTPLSDSELSEEEDQKPVFKPSLMVKIKYKKAMAKSIERIIKLTPRPDKPVIKVSTVVKDDSNSSEDDMPLAKTSAAQKRPSSSVGADTAKNDKKRRADETIKSAGPKTITVSTSKSSSLHHDSPPASSLNPKDLLATPKKGDAMKSVAMRRVDSQEGQSRTPQPIAHSTPTSVARSATSEPRVLSPEAEKLRSEQKKCGELALNAKRKMDSIIRHKERPRPEIEPKDHKLGLATGLEATIMYIYSNSINTRVHELAGTHVSRIDSCSNVIPLLTWLTHESRSFPVMHALTLHISAIAKELYERELAEAVTRNPRDGEAVKQLVQNSQGRTNDWLEAEKVKDVLTSLGGATYIGPGMDIKTITDYVLGVLTAFSRTEKTGWKKDGGFVELRKNLSG